MHSLKGLISPGGFGPEIEHSLGLYWPLLNFAQPRQTLRSLAGEPG
jgi:hypothetical protein